MPLIYSIISKKTLIPDMSQLPFSCWSVLFHKSPKTTQNMFTLSGYMTILGGSSLLLKISLAIEASAHSELSYIQSCNPSKLTKDQLHCKIRVFFYYYYYYSSVLGLTILPKDKMAMILRRKWRGFFLSLTKRSI